MRDVQLVEITEANLRAVVAMEVRPDQSHLVAPNAVSLAEAWLHHEQAWPRAITSDGELVGFVQVWFEHGSEDGKDCYLWRLMVDPTRQGEGIGSRAVALVIDEVRRRGGAELHVSWVPGEGSPSGMYERLGFVPTGEIDDGEVVARLVV